MIALQVQTVAARGISDMISNVQQNIDAMSSSKKLFNSALTNNYLKVSNCYIHINLHIYYISKCPCLFASAEHGVL